MYIKEEQGDKPADVLILDGIEGNILGDTVTEYSLTSDEMINAANNMCMPLGDVTEQVRLLCI